MKMLALLRDALVYVIVLGTAAAVLFFAGLWAIGEI